MGRIDPFAEFCRYFRIAVVHRVVYTREQSPQRPSAETVQSVRFLSRGAPVDQRLATVNGVGLGRQPAVGLMQNKRRGDPERRPRTFHRRDEHPMGGDARARMDRQERERAEPVLRRGEDRRQRIRPMNHDEAPAGLEDRDARANRADERSRAGFAGKDMRTRPRPVGRDANRARFEERRIGHDRIGLSVGEPRRASRACIAHVEPQDSRALGHSVAFGITGGQGCKIGVDLDEVGAGVWAAAENGKRDRADARADIRETTLRKIRRRGEQRRVGSRPMAAPGLDEGQTAAEPGVAGSPPAAARRPSTDSAIAQFGCESSIREQSSRPRFLARLDQNPPRQESERSLYRGHVLIGDKEADARRPQKRFDRADQHEIIRTQNLDQWRTSRGALAPSYWRLYGRMTGSGKGKRHVGLVIPLGEKSADRLIEPLSTLVADDMERVNQTILSRTGSDVTMIPEVANHLISSGGKRLRPILTLATAGMCDYAGTGHVKLAAAVEFMHTATLLHDDVVDESDMRRGKAAARVLWGNEASVLVGDFLLGQAFKMMVEVGSLQCLEVMSSAAAVIAEGEVMQLSAAKDTETTEDAYIAVIRAKTAALFAAACEVGPILANRPRAEIAACRGYGANLGIAFQLIDDALDYGGSAAKLGKNVGDDFREGKITLPVVLSFRRGAPPEREFWKRTLEVGEVVEGDLEIALATMKKHRALEDTIERARHYGAMAVDALELFPASPWKHALRDAVEFAVSRAH